MNLDKNQAEAVRTARTARLSIITGGPGVGKTHTIRAICDAYHGDVSLAAPTGKAASRMTEATSIEAKTIHRLLEYSPFTGRFTRDSENKIDARNIIIDEASMMDIRLMRSLLDAIPEGARLVLVGDKDQLPSVGPGQVLADLIASKRIPVTFLTTIYRQGDGSTIAKNAQLINAGKPIDESPAEDFFFIETPAVENVKAKIPKVLERLQERFSVRRSEMQVLCPQKKTIIGADHLNIALQDFFNPHGRQCWGTKFRSGDRVIQTRNNYQLDVFNGESGSIYAADEESIVVNFGMRSVRYNLDTAADELQKAWALTVHKSQGSEFPVVVMPVHESNYMMLHRARALLYTGITRARRKAILIGSRKALTMAIRNESNTRYTRLKALLNA